jgi:hypothetical protein
MAATGLLMFALSPLAAVIGVVDPNAKRGTALALASLVTAPLGLLIAAF